MTDLRLVLDDAAVDGKVSAHVTVEAGNGDVATFPMPEVDQHCPDDGFVELATPDTAPESRIDDLRPTPYRYAVTLNVDGKRYAGTGLWTGEGTQYGGDAELTFEPPLASLG